jgi:pyruvate dehydrogenase E1 component alpha subunit
MNFAGVWHLPIVFVVQNNQWAISVPLKKQTHSRTIAQKALAYGFPGLQVDGNDALAVYAASREAVERARRGDGPSLIECVTYRLSMHTTSDDPTKYRSAEEVQAWERKDPLTRFGAYLQKRNLLDGGLEEEIDAEIGRAVRSFEAIGPADPLGMFDHAYATRPAPLDAQRAEMQARLAQAPAADPAAPAGGAADGAGEPAPVTPESPPMRGQRRPWRS